MSAPGLRVVAGGGDAIYLARALNALAPSATAIVSWGLAGGLRDDMAPGDWIVGSRVEGEFVHNCEPTWARNANSKLISAHTTPGRVWNGPVHGGFMVADAASKRMLGKRGALGVDMESHIAGEVAAAHNLPFLILRVVSDRIDQDVPPAARVAMGLHGRTNYGAIARSLLRDPGQLRAFYSFAREAGDAMAALRWGRRALGGNLGFVPADVRERAAYVI